MNVLNDFPVNAKIAPAVTFTAADRGFVYAVARRIVGSAEDADDVTQEALLLAYRHRSAFRGESRYRTWLYRIAATTALGHLRKRARSREQLAPTEAAYARNIASDATPIDEALADHENIVRIQQALEELDPKYRDVMLLRADLSEVETAETLGITVGNVKVRAHRARAQLRLALEVDADAA
jgi:RNA polymerase sigma-70 factor, ECF subfamily